MVDQSLKIIRGTDARGWAAGIVLLLVSLLLATLPARAAQVENVAFAPSGKGGELVITLAGAPGRVAVMALASPARLVVDIGQTRLGGTLGNGAGAVSRIRAGQFDAETVRIVLDLSTPLLVAGSTLSDDGEKINIRLDGGSDAAFAQSIRTGHKVISAGATASAPSAPAGKADPPPAKPRTVSKPPAVSPDVRGKRPLVVIDAGHGGHDTGAISVYGDRREKDLTLAISRAIVDEINASGRVRAALTRSDDRFLVLRERVEIARRQGADLFISVHADSAPNTGASGATVYTLSEVASDKEAARLAAKENKADIVNGIDLGKEAGDVSSILIDLAQRETMNVSSAFAALLQRELAPHVKFRSRFHRFAGFAVLKAADTPAVLLETGYLTNMDDAKFLYSNAGKKAFALGVRKAVEAHFARRHIPR